MAFASSRDLLGRALAAHRAGNLDDAEAIYQTLLKRNPRDFHALRLLGAIAGQRGDPALAARLSASSLAVNPQQATALNNLGMALRELGQHQQALAAFDKAVSLNPDHAAAQWNRGLSKLLAGDFLFGWQLYEWRWKADGVSQRAYPQPLWRGAATVPGTIILLYAEQGLGDTIQFCRYVELAAARGAEVVLEVQPSLASLMSSLAGAARVIAAGDPVPNFDRHCPLPSLPLVFRTALDNVPARTPYLRASAQATARWRERLGSSVGPRVGLAWSGNPKHSNDRNRSIALSQLLPLLDCGAQIISLQKELRPRDAPVLAEAPQIATFSADLADFDDTAALVSLLDLVISVDTAVAHLAGALGKPVWILLPFSPDWRWLLDRSDSPWYPTVRLFRQPRFGDWATVVTRICHELRLWARVGWRAKVD